MIPVDKLMKLSHSLTVLYVEDDLHIRQEMQEVLENFFKVVIVAKDGAEGFQAFQVYKKETGTYPDIVMTDISMPLCNGIEMSGKILAHHAEQSIIVLSAHNDAEHLLSLINMGIEHYLLKPVQTEQILQVLQRAVKKIQYRKMELQYTAELEKMAYNDSMTGISNRRRFFEKAKSFFANNVFHRVPVYLFMFDIDKFKIINDTYGHDVGDEVIKAFVSSVKKEISAKECFARFGGDEFILMMQMNEREALHTVEKIQEHISKIDLVLGLPLHFTVSTGMAKIDASDNNIELAIKRADVSLYEEKQAKNALFVVNA